MSITNASSVSRTTRTQRRVWGARTRLGTAAVEAAVTLPLLFVLVFGAIETANAIFLRQALAIASYEGARAVTRPGATQAMGQTRVDDVLSARGVTGYTTSFSPVISATTPRGAEVSVTVQTTVGTGGLGPLRLYAGKQITQITRMVRL